MFRLGTFFQACLISIRKARIFLSEEPLGSPLFKAVVASGPVGLWAKGPRGQGAKGPKGQGAKGPRGKRAKGLRG